MNKVAIFGNAGGGKSTLAKNLSNISGLPLYHLDFIQYYPDGLLVPPEEYRQAHDKILTQSKWIIEGFGNLETLWNRLEQADTLIHIDLPLWLHFYWVTKRFFKGIFATPYGWPKGSPIIKSTLSSYRVLWLCHKKLTPKYREFLSAKMNSKQVYSFKSKAEIRFFLEEIKLRS